MGDGLGCRNSSTAHQVQIATNIFGFSITNDGRDLALAEQLPVIELLDLEKPYEPRRSLRAASNHVTAVVFSPDGRILAMAGYGNAGLLDSQSGRTLDVFDYPVNHSAIRAGLRAGR